MFPSLLLLAGSFLGLADAPAAGDLKLEVRRLVRQLDSPQLAQRDTAEEKLLGMGPPALELLPPVTEAMGAEVRQRLARIRQKLEHAVAESAAQPSLVTLQGDAVPLSQVLAALEEQTGNRIIDRRRQQGEHPPDPAIAVALDCTPFWQALDQILDQAGLSVYAFGEEKAIYLVNRQPGQVSRTGRASCAGPFRVEPIRVDARRDLRQQSAAMAVALEVAWEPRLAPVSLRVKMAEVEAADERGRPLAVQSPEAELEIPVDTQSSVTELRISLVPPPWSVQKIASLALSLEALLPGRMETFRFDSLPETAPAEKRTAGATVTLSRVRRNRDVWEVYTRVRFDQAAGALASHRTWVFQNPAWLETPKGERIPYHAFDTISQGENEVSVAYLFALPGPLAEHRFVYQTPASILSTSSRFILEDIRLP